MNAIIPIPKFAISIRPGTMDDLAFIDALQKKNSKQVGFFKRAALEGKIRLGHLLIAEEGAERIGYLMGNDQYFKRDDLGIIFQINIAEGKRRALVGAMLLKAQFERSAYGCKLYCCWCAQDIEANRFWESMGFVPLAFRAGSAKKDRVHIFWQKRIRAGDCVTPWWFPSQTNGGSIREDRLVLPIPPGMRWNDEMPRILPREESPKLEAPNPKRIRSPKFKMQNATTVQMAGGLRLDALVAPKGKSEPGATQIKPKKQKQKNDPKFVAAARELRDRWLERVNEDPSLLEGTLSSTAKYQVTRQIQSTSAAPMAMLPQAA